MTELYSRFFANPLRNGMIDIVSDAVGKLAWSRKIGDIESDSANVRLLLSGEDYVIADNLSELVCVKRNGDIAWRRPCWYSSQTALQDGVLYFTDPERNDFMQAVDANNSVTRSGERFWGMVDNAYLTLFEPGADETFCQVQLVHDPHNEPPLMMCYREDRSSPGMRWSVDLECEGSPIIPLLNRAQKRLVTSTRTEIVVLDTESVIPEPAPAARFPFPLHEATHWVSSADDGRLFWCGTGEQGATLGITDFAGEMQWRYEKGLAGRAIAPPVVGKELIWLVTDQAAYAFKDGKLAWKYDAGKTTLTFATAVVNDTLLLCGIDRLIRLDSDGLTEFDLKFEEPLSAPPVADASGQIYIASRGIIYAFV